MISDLDLLAAIKEETSEAFVIFGELRRDKNGALALLAAPPQPPRSPRE